MADLYDNNGAVVVHDDSKACDLCGHYDDNRKAAGLHPAIILIQTFGGVLAGVSLAIVNLYMLPENTWDTQETSFIAAFVMMPSLALWIILFGLQILELHDEWFKLVIWIIVGSGMTFVFMWLIDKLLEKVSMFAGVVS